MRTNLVRTILATVLALGMVSGRAAAAEPTAAEPAAAEPAAAENAPAAQPTPRLAATPAAAPAAAGTAGWHEGFQFVPAIGIHSFQGTGAQSTGPGLRLGLLAGSRVAELVSLNVGFAFDIVNFDSPSASDYILDIGFNPLFHFPLEKLEIIAGPILGVFVDKAAFGSGSQTVDSWAYGWTAGVNAGLMFPVGAKVRLGGLANFFLRNPLKVCVTGADTCVSDGLNSGKIVALSFAAML